VAQDFRAAFALGDDDQHIATVDAAGVALAAIQGLNQIVCQQGMELRARSSRIEALEKRLVELERVVALLAGAKEQASRANLGG
jgi:predicted MarR family transcription regulator